MNAALELFVQAVKSDGNAIMGVTREHETPESAIVRVLVLLAEQSKEE